MRCVDEGVEPETVDAAALAFGMPMGPIELADTVGLDIAMAAALLASAVATLMPRHSRGRTSPPRCQAPSYAHVKVALGEVLRQAHQVLDDEAKEGARDAIVNPRVEAVVNHLHRPAR